jgi:hypothetical protein
MASKTPKPKKTTTSQAPNEKELATAPKLAAGPTKKTAKPAPVKSTGQAAISSEEVAQRAYFIAQERRQSGASGSETQDWLNAEAQLKAELKPKKTSAKKPK